MANSLENAIARTRALAGLGKARGLDDRQLLRQFANGDESAFTILVERHGGLVMGVCRRVLQHTQDAEDAFQATFLVLAGKATKVAWEASIANWLHSVACRIAFQVRREKLRRRGVGSPLAEPSVNGADPAWSELKPLLDEELDRLPARYRIPLILCCLEGKSRDEAAAQLGWSLGSLKGRLERGRELLRSRLARRGLALSTGLAALLVSGGSAKASVPLTLGIETVRAGMAMLSGQTAGIVPAQVATLAQGALHAMFMTKLKIAAAVVLAVLTFGLGSGYVTHQVLAGQRRADPNATERPRDVEATGQREGSGERKASPSVTGFVKSADDAKITIIVSRDNLEGETYQVAKNVKIVIRGRESKEGKLADLQPRTRVKLNLDDAKKVVQSVEIQAARPEGDRPREAGNVIRSMVSEIDAAKRKITFVTPRRGEPDTTETYDLAKDVKVTKRAGRTVKEAKLEDVKPKTYVTARLDDAKKVVQAIEITISTTRFGMVSEITADSITLVTPRRGEAQDAGTTYALGKSVKVQYRSPGGGDEGRGVPKVVECKIGDVAAKGLVNVQLDDALKTVEVIDLQLPLIQGTVQSIDAKKFTLLLRPGRGDDKQFDIAKEARIMVDGKAGNLDGIAVGAEVHAALSPDGSRVLFLQTPLPKGREE